MTLALTSPAFAHRADMPRVHTCQGEDTSPPLRIAGVPKGAKSLVLTMDDPDAPDPKAPKLVWDHWVVFDIPPTMHEILENTSPPGARVAKNGWGRNDYGGPCPPIGKHRYFFTLYALDKALGLPASATKADVLKAAQGHVLEKTELIGMYEKHA